MKDIFSSWRVPMSGKADALVERNEDYARESWMSMPSRLGTIIENEGKWSGY